MVSLREIIEKFGFKISKAYEQDGKIIINFYDPRLGDDIYYYSSLFYDKQKNKLEITVRTLMTKKFKEFYFDYCVEDGEFMCRPHIWHENCRLILSNQATFRKDVISKLRGLLNEYSPRTT